MASAEVWSGRHPEIVTCSLPPASTPPLPAILWPVPGRLGVTLAGGALAGAAAPAGAVPAGGEAGGAVAAGEAAEGPVDGTLPAPEAGFAVAAVITTARVPAPPSDRVGSNSANRG
jgi:hypothetical protein